MAYARTRKHYRVAQKEAAKEALSGVVIPDKHINKFILAAVGLLVVVFVKGIIIGCLAFRREDEI